MGMYYGSKVSFACESCDSLYLMQGTKWGQIDMLSQSRDWEALLKSYSAIMFADDDLGMSTHVLNRAFEIFEEQGLQLAQPSVCRHPNSGSQQAVVHQKEGLLLRHTAFVEIMAPIFSTNVLRGPLARALRGGHSGWGLDHIWPHLLGYPHKGIAVIDEVCMTHPIQQPNKQSVYARKRPDGLDPWGEYTMLCAKYGVTETVWRQAGIPGPLGAHVWSEVPLPAAAEHPQRQRAFPALAPLPTSAEGSEGLPVVDDPRLVREAQLLGAYRAPYAVAHIRLVHISELTPALAGASGCLALGGMLGALWARRRYRRHGELGRLGCKGVDRGGTLARNNTSPSLACYKLPL